MERKFPIRDSQDPKNSKLRCGFLRFAVYLVVLFNALGCTTASRSPAPSNAMPAENAEQLAPQTMQPKAPSSKKLDAAYSQDQASYHFSMGQAHSLDADLDKAIEEYKLALI